MLRENLRNFEDKNDFYEPSIKRTKTSNSKVKKAYAPTAKRSTTFKEQVLRVQQPSVTRQNSEQSPILANELSSSYEPSIKHNESPSSSNSRKGDASEGDSSPSKRRKVVKASEADVSACRYKAFQAIVPDGLSGLDTRNISSIIHQPIPSLFSQKTRRLLKAKVIEKDLVKEVRRRPASSTQNNELLHINISNKDDRKGQISQHSSVKKEILVANGKPAEDLNGDSASSEVEFKELSARDLVYATTMPIRLESMHSLEHRLLRVWDAERPNSLVYACPLCDSRVEKPKTWRYLYEHYRKTHWEPRRYIGQFVVFPCAQAHGFDKLTSSNLVPQVEEEETECSPVSADVTSDKGRIRKSRRLEAQLKTNRKFESTGQLSLHFHCPSKLCLDQIFLSFDNLKHHCRNCHTNSRLDPKCTPVNPSVINAPLLDLKSFHIIPLRAGKDSSEEDQSSDEQQLTSTSPQKENALLQTPSEEIDELDGIKSIFQMVPSSPPESANTSPFSAIARIFNLPKISSRLNAEYFPTRTPKRETNDERPSTPISSHLESPSSEDQCSAFMRPISSGSERKSDRVRERRKVRFSDQVVQVAFDKERSQREQCGSSLGKAYESKSVLNAEPYEQIEEMPELFISLDSSQP